MTRFWTASRRGAPTGRILVGALGRHLALAGFMGAGKSAVGARVAELTAQPFVDLDRRIEERHGPDCGAVRAW